MRGVFSAVVVGCLLIGGALRPAAAGSSFAENKRVLVSTAPLSPTLISARGNYKRTLLINNTTSYCLFGDHTTVFVATGTARITNTSFSPDGPYEPYQGAIYGVCESIVSVECLRLK